MLGVPERFRATARVLVKFGPVVVAAAYILTVSVYIVVSYVNSEDAAGIIPRSQEFNFIIGGISILILTCLLNLFVEGQDYRDVIKRLTRQLSAHPSVKIIVGSSDSYTETYPLVEEAKHKFEIILSGGPKAPPPWLTKVRRRMKERATLGTPMQFVVSIFSSAKAAKNEEFIKANQERLRLFQSDELDVIVDVIEMDRPLGIDVMVIDTNHVCIGISPRPYSGRSATILIENDPEAAALFSDWISRRRQEGTVINSWRTEF